MEDATETRYNTPTIERFAWFVIVTLKLLYHAHENRSLPRESQHIIRENILTTSILHLVCRHYAYRIHEEWIGRRHREEQRVSPGDAYARPSPLKGMFTISRLRYLLYAATRAFSPHHSSFTPVMGNCRLPRQYNGSMNHAIVVANTTITHRPPSPVTTSNSKAPSTA